MGQAGACAVACSLLVYRCIRQFHISNFPIKKKSSHSISIQRLTSMLVLILAIFYFNLAFSNYDNINNSYFCSVQDQENLKNQSCSVAEEVKMEDIEHRFLQVNNINIHIAEAGPVDGPVILFIHGFPELWYTWRHQIIALASLGYRTIAPDMRGYGDTDAPADPQSYTCFHIIGDLIAILDAVAPEQEKVFVVGHDWGAYIAWYLSLFRPDRVKALVNLSVAFSPRNPKRKPLEGMRAVYGDEYYVCRFQEAGEIEAEFEELGTERIIKEFYTCRNPGPLLLPKGHAFSRTTPLVLPEWLSEEDIQYYVRKFEKKGFTGGLNYYRIIDRNWEITAPWTGSKIKVPAKFIVGDQDLTYNTFGTKDFIEKGGLKKFVPFLEEVVIMEGVGHFINEEKPEEINKHIYDFFQKF